jgi:HK97 family phage prohead protease
MNREFRIIHGTAIRAKADKPGIEGYAAKFNEEYDNGWFIETIKPGAFTRAVKEKQDVRGLMNHDANLVLGRTKSGTLSLNQDATGLYFECDLPDTQTARDLYELVKRGDIDGCSFGFQVMAQSWREAKDANGKMIQYREIEDVDLFDVGPVTFPAYPQTSVDARALFPDGVPVEVRQRIPEFAEPKEVVPAVIPVPEVKAEEDPKLVEARAQLDSAAKQIEKLKDELLESRVSLMNEKHSQIEWLKRVTAEIGPASKLFDSTVSEIDRRIRIESDHEALSARLTSIQNELTETHAMLVKDKQSNAAWMQRVSAEIVPAAKSLGAALSDMVRRVRLATID